MNKVKFLRCEKSAILPTKAYSGDQCFDLYSIEDLAIYPGETKKVRTGLKCVLPVGYGLEFRERSSAASLGLKIGGGIIDNAYRGELIVILHNVNKQFVIKDELGDNYLDPYASPILIKIGNKIAQAELVKTEEVEIEEISEIDFQYYDQKTINSRGNKGFGSSDK